jgi:DNA-binding MurR/RpiR family transcriptional regulator
MGKITTRQQFLESQIRKYSSQSDMEHRLQRCRKRVLKMSYHGMDVTLRCMACGEYFITVSVDGEMLMHASLSVLQTAISRGYKIKG